MNRRKLLARLGLGGLAAALGTVFGKVSADEVRLVPGRVGVSEVPVGTILPWDTTEIGCWPDGGKWEVVT